MSRRVIALALAVASLGFVVAGCSSGNGADRPEPAAQSVEQRFPDVVDVAIEGADGSYDFDVTVSSPYDTPERYADGWRVLAPDGTVLGERRLAHDHANEQPFTRSLTGVSVPAGITEVTVGARDLANGYGGERVVEELPDR